MIDPKVVLILLAIYGTTWGIGQTVKGAKWLGHEIKSGVHHILHPHKVKK